MKCLIIAAGRGERLKRKGMPKPLIPVLGVPMIARVIHTAARAGVDDFFVVTGFTGEKIEAYLAKLASDCGLRITCLENPDWEKGNGSSVLTAEDVLREPFLLLMADHLIGEKTLRRLMEEPPDPDEIKLMVDPRVDNPLIDLSDATKVRREGGRVVAIGKGLKRYDAIDTGIFYCTPAIFQAIERSMEERGDATLTGGVRILAEWGKVTAVYMGEEFWIDIDDVFALEKAEEALLSRLRKPTDGPVARYINRPISLMITRWLVKFPLSPNTITLMSFLLSLLATGFFLLCRSWALAAGGVLAQFSSVVDGCDGEVARLTFRESAFGKWVDAVLDRYADATLIAGMTVYALCHGGGWGTLSAGFLAIMGSFGVSYTADKYDGLMRRKVVFSRFRVGRDVRVFIIFLGAVLFVPLWSLWVLAILMNMEVARRIAVASRFS